MLPPETGTQSEMAGFSFFEIKLFQMRFVDFQATDKAHFFLSLIADLFRTGAAIGHVYM